MPTRVYNPSQGQAFQGDVSIIPLPAGIAFSTADEIRPIDGRLIIQEGEMTGHHHAIALPRERRFKSDRPVAGDALQTASPKLRKAFGGGKRVEIGTARLYRDPAAAAAMVARGLLTRADLAVAVLVVEGAPVTISHEEHDGISVPPGNYLVGRQIESAGAEERVVAD